MGPAKVLALDRGHSSALSARLSDLGRHRVLQKKVPRIPITLIYSARHVPSLHPYILELRINLTYPHFGTETSAFQYAGTALDGG